MKRGRLLTLFFLLLVLPSFAKYSKAIDDLIGEVKEASYYDSARLFKIGEKTIVKATALSNQAAIAEVHLYYGN